MANKETGFDTIKCPGCGEAIPISEAIHHQIAERTRQEFKAEALEAKRLLPVVLKTRVHTKKSV